MSSIEDIVRDYLNSLDQSPYKIIDEMGISEGILEILKSHNIKASGDNLYEVLAFEFFPRNEGQPSEWGTFFGSKLTLKNKDGELIEYPSLQQINVEAIEYWAKRALEAKHPILVARYADLVCDFARNVNRLFDHKLVQLAIDNLLMACEQDLVIDIYQRYKLHRALKLSLLINDNERIRQVALMTISIEKRIAKDDKPGLWGFTFKWFVLENKNISTLKASEVESLIIDLENRLTRIMNTEDPDTWNVECAVNLLSAYYIGKNDAVNALRVLLTLEGAFRTNKRSNLDGLLKVNYLEKLDALYRQNGAMPGMRKHINRIAKELPIASKESLSSLKQISVEVNIKKEDIDRLIYSVYGDLGQGSNLEIKDVVTRLLGNFLIHKDRVKKQVDEFSKRFVFKYIVKSIRMSVDGHTEAIIPPLEDDYEAHLFDQAFQDVQLVAPLFAEVTRIFKEKFTPEETYNHLKRSPLFSEEESDYILTGLKAYWSKEYLSSSQIFIPFIESAFRKLVAMGGGITLRPGNKYGGYEFKSLDALLEDDIVNKVFGFDISFYLKLMLTHPLGWNLRNNLAHGINLNAFFRQDIADRLFHILLIISLVREEKNHK